jgi:hypothetical protein
MAALVTSDVSSNGSDSFHKVAAAAAEAASKRQWQLVEATLLLCLKA